MAPAPDEDDTAMSLDLDAPGKELGQALSAVVMSPRFSAIYHLPASGEVTIGRSKSAELYVDEPLVSRTHAILSLGSQLTIRDLGSSNGTRVGGVRIRPDDHRALQIGDAITVGPATILLQRRVEAVKPRRFWSADELVERLDEECTRATRSGRQFTVACVRVDRLAFHANVRQVLATALGVTDIVGEYGPSDYAIILTDPAPGEARAVLERIERELAARKVRARWGVAEFHRDGTVAHRLLAAAQLAIAQLRGPQPASKQPIIVEPAMLALFDFVRMIAAGELGVLVLGETGAGKEVVAAEVHRLSPRAAGPFLRLNCGALSEMLLESELFGHEKGAFTSAEKAKPGLIESAAGGTVFLDEVGELPASLQVKLLRVIEDKHALRVGGLTPRALDVRFVAATNRDLEQQVARGLFRADLYYRLAGATVTVPPLRERPADIEPLARMFLQNAGAHLGDRMLDFEPAALALIRGYAWPGNVRELRNAIERAALICGPGPIAPVHLPSALRSTEAGTGTLPALPAATSVRAPRPVEAPGPELDDAHIVAVLAACGGNQSRAAKQLGLSRGALIRRLEKLAVIRPRKPTR